MSEHRRFAYEQLKPLTSLRFLAALLVLVYHCQPTAAIGTTYALGHAGVAFFFLLSGFILTVAYHRHFAVGLSWDSVRAFYVARIARIYPLHLLTMGLAIAVLWRFGETSWDRSDAITRTLAFAAHLSLTQSWFPNEKVYFGLNSPAWSLSVEAFFYALFPFLIASLLRSFAGRPPRAILVAASLPWLMLVAIVFIPHRVVVWVAYVAPPIRLVDFLVGMMVAIAFIRQRELSAKLAYATLFEAAAIAAVVGAIFVSPRLPEVLRYALFLMPFWTLLIWVFAWQQGLISRLLSKPVFVRLGEVSFALYLVHWITVQTVTRTIGWQHAAFSMVVTLAVTISLSLVLFSLVEQPLRRYIRMAMLGKRPNTLARPGTFAAPGCDLSQWR